MLARPINEEHGRWCGLAVDSEGIEICAVASRDRYDVTEILDYWRSQKANCFLFDGPALVLGWEPKEDS